MDTTPNTRSNVADETRNSHVNIDDKEIELLIIASIIVTRNNMAWKLVHGYFLCYCKTFSLVPDSTERTNFFLPKSAVHHLYHLKSNTSFNLKLSCT